MVFKHVMALKNKMHTLKFLISDLGINCFIFIIFLHYDLFFSVSHCQLSVAVLLWEVGIGDGAMWCKIYTLRRGLMHLNSAL